MCLIKRCREVLYQEKILQVNTRLSFPPSETLLLPPFNFLRVSLQTEGVPLSRWDPGAQSRGGRPAGVSPVSAALSIRIRSLVINTFPPLLCARAPGWELLFEEDLFCKVSSETVITGHCDNHRTSLGLKV